MKRAEAPKKPNSVRTRQAVNLGRHESQCTICAHPKRDEVEDAFVNWTSVSKIAEEYAVSRDGVYRHAHALGLMDKRRRNVRAALERIIEKAGEVDVTAAAVVGAVSAYARINARGEWVERTETVNLAEMFQRLTAVELDAYAKDGSLPDWFKTAMGATDNDSQGATNVK